MTNDERPCDASTERLRPHTAWGSNRTVTRPFVAPRKLRRALSIHDFRHERLRLAEVDEVGGDGVFGGQRFEIGERALHLRGFEAAEERRRRARLRAARRGRAPSRRSTVFGNAARRHLGSDAAEARGARRRRRRRASRSTAGTARSPTLRMLPWKPRPATWCWPQPFGQPLILMRSSGASAATSGCCAQVRLEQRSEAARLRDREPARLGAGAARDVGDRAGAREPEPRRREPRVERLDVDVPNPAEHEVLLRRHAHACRRCRHRRDRRGRASAGRVMSPSGIVAVTSA